MNHISKKLILSLCLPCLLFWKLESKSGYANTGLLPPACEMADKVGYAVSGEDIIRYNALMEALSEKVLHTAPIGDIISTAALFFLETPYVAGRLDQAEEEMLVFDLHGLDCVTFVENVMAASLAYRAQQSAFYDFAGMLQCLRYRNGQIDGYASRLHYFTDWLLENVRKGLLQLVSNEIGTKHLEDSVSFMSSNAHLYKQLHNPSVFKQIREAEEKLSKHRFHYIPKRNIALYEDHIKDGDILAFVTNIAGLDVSHSGFAFFVDGRLHLLHASSRSQKVEITDVPLHFYVANNESIAGILVARVL